MSRKYSYPPYKFELGDKAHWVTPVSSGERIDRYQLMTGVVDGRDRRYGENGYRLLYSDGKKHWFEESELVEGEGE